MLSGVRFRAYPAPSQAAVLRQWIGHQRFVYNAKVREADYWRSFGRRSLALTGQVPLPDQAYSQFISESTSFLQEVPSQVLRNGAYRFATGSIRSLKGLGGAPVVRKRHGRQSVLLTSELFEFVERTDAATGEVRRDLVLGTKKRPLGRLHFKAHRPYEAAKMLSISVEADGRWYVSLCFEAAPVLPGSEPGSEPVVLRTPDELAYEFGLLEPAQMQEAVVGLDRGVAVPVALSDGQTFDIPAVCRERIDKKERAAKRYQRRLARQTLGSRNRAKTKQRFARCRGYGANVRQDFAHKTSHALVTSPVKVFVFEDLKLKNMTAAPAPKQDAAGRYTANGAAAKAGLNKALLASALGRVRQYTVYKAERCNKLVLDVSPYRSSQECAECGHTAPENRPSQAVFLCTKCHHADNADHNAARVIQKRGIELLNDGVPVRRQKKTARVRGRLYVGPERSERGENPTPEENMSVGVGGHAANCAEFREPGNRHLNAGRR